VLAADNSGQPLGSLGAFTVRRHVSSGLAKLGVSSREEAIRLMSADEKPRENNTAHGGAHS
jgi:hypothetical protein